MAKKQKRLNIYNSNRYYNVHLVLEDDIKKFIPVTKLNEEAIEEKMDELKELSTIGNRKDNEHYLLFNEDFNNDTLIKKLFDHGGQVDFYTQTTVPYYIIERLSKRLNSRALFYIRKSFSKKEIENVQLTFTACPVVIDIPIVLPDTNPYDILMALHDLKASVDRVQFSFPRLNVEDMTPNRAKYYRKEGEQYTLKPKFRYAFFKYIQNSLSIWAMNIDLVCYSVKDYNEMNYLINNDKRQRSSQKEV